ncbi:ATP-binding protein [Megamonas hypermegale]|uniref:ATP-binding protein n=1 Tax=Megamonas hypermegale TaxID=158847 RepID=UPI001EF462D7|nr:ATP-binding protein [Megamonas hypermegale]
MIKSKINPMLTLEYMVHEHENKYFDRKSAKIKPSDLAPLISAFANAEGGTIVIGIDDKTLEIEGTNIVTTDKLNDFINAAKDYCKPMPTNKYEYLNVINKDNKPDKLLLIHIFSSINQIIQTRNDTVWLRIGDRTKEIKGLDLQNLEYSKNTRKYEDECTMDATIEDLDEELLNRYKTLLSAHKLPNEQILTARGLMKKIGDDYKLTNAAVLLFAKNILQFYPNCRIRFVRYEGNISKSGTQINIIKDKNIDCCILKIIDEAKNYIAAQLREFTALNTKDGKFQVVPEYPEFAWLEGIVNAVVHREYALSGDYILVTMYDDRLEIKSPGKLPDIVTLENIKNTRYSRNPKISRVLNEFGYVRELNEGVKRIYQDMKAFFLDDPEYSEPGQQSVKLTLKNNIIMRKIRQKERTIDDVGNIVWEQLDDLEKNILTYMGSKKFVNRRELEEHTKKSRATILNRLNHLIYLGVIKQNGRSRDPQQSYELLNKMQ